MISTLLNKWPDFVITLLGTALGFVLSILIVRIEDNKQMHTKKTIYLTNLLYEFEYNLSILHRIHVFINTGPDIDHLWAPAKTNADFLATNAWNELILAGVLSTINNSTLKNLQVTSRTVLDVKRVINEVSENWVRVKEWNEYNKNNDNQQLMQRPLFKETAINEMTGRVDYSIENLKKSIALIKEIIVKNV